MAKNKKPLALKAAYDHQVEQSRLRKNHGIEDDDVIIVERKSRFILFWRTTLGFVLTMLSYTASLVLAILAIIGLATLIIPNIRAEFLEAMNMTLNSIKTYLTF